MSGKILMKALLPIMLLAAVALSSCGAAKAANSATTSISPTAATSSAGVSSADGTRYSPTWITPVVSGDSVSVPVSAITQGKMVHFWVTTASGKESFMAYTLDGVTYMRASICVPCRGTSFSLQKGILVCDTCGTKFNAKTGMGVSGACINYPKAAVTYTLSSGNLVTSLTNLASAYADTLQAG